MKSRFISIVLVLLAVATAIPASAQNVISKKQWKSTTRICYHTENGSVLPIHKYSIDICINKDSIVGTIYRAGIFAGSIVETNTEEAFNDLKARLAALGLGCIPEDRVGEQPLGGGITSVSCYNDKSAIPYYNGYLASGVGTLTLKHAGLDGAFFLLPVNEMRLLSVFPEQLPSDPEPTPVLIVKVPKEKWAGTNHVCYYYADGSTPPDWHRNYEIEVSPDSIVLTITGYSEVFLHTVYPFTPEQFAELKTALEAQEFAVQKGDMPIMPVGGATESVAFYTDPNEEPFFAAYRTMSGVGTLRVGHGTAAEYFLRLLPEPLEVLIDSTRQQH